MVEVDWGHELSVDVGLYHGCIVIFQIDDLMQDFDS